MKAENTLLIISDLSQEIGYLRGRAWLFFALAGVCFTTAVILLPVDYVVAMFPFLLSAGLFTAAYSNWTETRRLGQRIKILSSIRHV